MTVPVTPLVTFTSVSLAVALVAACTRPSGTAIAKDPAPSTTASTSTTPAPVGPPIRVYTGKSFGDLNVAANVTTSVAMRVEIEYLVGGAFTARPRELYLIDGCDGLGISAAKLPPCRTIAAGEVLIPPPFKGYSCSSQCAVPCTKNVQIHGTIRYVVKSCDGNLRWESPPVVVPGP